MNLKVDWEKLKRTYHSLVEDNKINAETEITFILIMRNGTAKKSIIKFKDFLNFFWTIFDNPRHNVLALVVQDKDGRVIYRHKQITSGNEEIPIGGNANIILNWGTLKQEEKDVFVQLMIAQFDAYER